MKRVLAHDLRKLRNLIPINRLIKEQLNIKSKCENGLFRFLCPLCNKFHTATNPKTNLARCFSCKKSFNPIDLVMIVKGFSFLETVKYLISFLPNIPNTSNSTGTYDNRLDRRQNIRQILSDIEKRIGIR